jgi:hypothetical protein
MHFDDDVLDLAIFSETLERMFCPDNTLLIVFDAKLQLSFLQT